MSIAAMLAAAVLMATPETASRQLGQAEAGDVVRFAPGDYGRVTIKDKRFLPRLTLEAGDAKMRLFLIDSSGIDVVGGQFGGTRAAAPDGGAAAEMTRFDANGRRSIPSAGGGDLQTGYGAMIKGSSHVEFRGGRFADARTGLIISHSTDVVARDLRFERMTSDGINIAAAQRVLVERIECHDFDPSPGAHPDCVQLWSPPSGATADITVRDSLARGRTQGFAGFNHPEKGQTGFDRIKFIDNRAEVSFPHGISIYDCRDCEITGNVARPYTGARHRVIVRVIRCTDCMVADNSNGPRPERAAAPAN